MSAQDTTLDPRPIAKTRCWDCGAGPDTDPAGDPHGWSCEQVPAGMFREYVVKPDTAARAADVIEPFLHGKFKIRERAEGSARDLETHGLLLGGTQADDVRDRAVNILQCRYSWRDAERIVDALADARLLAT